jgi:hypothetical protein
LGESSYQVKDNKCICYAINCHIRAMGSRLGTTLKPFSKPERPQGDGRFTGFRAALDNSDNTGCDFAPASSFQSYDPLPFCQD